jgi:hypothetical protein
MPITMPFSQKIAEMCFLIPFKPHTNRFLEGPPTLKNPSLKNQALQGWLVLKNTFQQTFKIAKMATLWLQPLLHNSLQLESNPTP